MKTLNEFDVVALEVAEMQTVQGGNAPGNGVVMGPNGEGCTPPYPFPRPAPPFDPYMDLLGRSWSV